MYRIALLNMPFASAQAPSIALTQLRSVVRARFGDRVAIAVVYPNQDCARLIGVDLYEEVANGAHLSVGLGDWLFRRLAFPELGDNAEQYFARYYPAGHAEMDRLRVAFLRAREKLGGFLDDVIQRYGLDRVDLAGMSSLFSQNVACFALARRLKAVNPAVTVVMGGANCESPMGQEIARQVAAVDAVFSGPALKSFPDFVESWLETDGGAQRIHGVFSEPGRASRRQEAAVATLELIDATSRTDEIGEDTDLGLPIDLDYDGFLEAFEHNFPARQLEPLLFFETSRGCWWGERSHCTFCGLNGLSMNYRAMAPAQAIETIRSLFRYAGRCRRMSGVDNILPMSYFKDVLPNLETPPEVSLFYEVKANLSDDHVQILKKSGVDEIQPGIEALSSKTLALMKKGSTAFTNIQLLKSCRLHGVKAYWNIIGAYPGEDGAIYDKYVRDIPLLYHLAPPIGIASVRFDRYSPLFDQAADYGLELAPSDFYALVYPFPPDSLKRLAYYFSDRQDASPLVETLEARIGELRWAIDGWKAAWEPEADLPPDLYLAADLGATAVYDSRYGEVLIHQLSDLGRRTLQALQTPHKIASLAAALDHPAEEALAAALDELRNRGLVFEEDGRLLSLVLPSKPAPLGAPASVT